MQTPPLSLVNTYPVRNVFVCVRDANSLPHVIACLPHVTAHRPHGTDLLLLGGDGGIGGSAVPEHHRIVSLLSRRFLPACARNV